MKKVLCVLVALGFAAIIIAGVINAKTRSANALWLNYRVNDAGTIALIRPDLPENKQPPVNLISFLQLPGSCLNADMENWQPGERGSIAFNKNWCKVDRYRVYTEEEAVTHYREVKERLRARQKS